MDDVELRWASIALGGRLLAVERLAWLEEGRREGVDKLGCEKADSEGRDGGCCAAGVEVGRIEKELF